MELTFLQAQRDPDDEVEGVFEQLVADAAKKEESKKEKKHHHKKRPGSTKSSKHSKTEDWEEVKMPGPPPQ